MGLLLLSALLPLGLPPVCGPLLLWLSTFAPPDPSCGAGRPQHWSALLQGMEVDCPERLVEGERSRWMLRKVAGDAAQPVQARVSALGALARGGVPDEELFRRLLSGPELAPGLRRELWAFAVESDPERWAEWAVAAGIHGLWARGQARLFAEGDRGALEILPTLGRTDPIVEGWIQAGLQVDKPALALACERRKNGQVPLDFPSSWWTALRAPECAAGGGLLLRRILEAEGHRQREDHQSPTPLKQGEEALDLLFYRNGAAGDLLREELPAIARWIQAGDPLRRLKAVLDHPEAAGPATDLLGLPWEGAGSVANVAAMASMILGESTLPVELSYQEGGVSMRLDEEELLVGHRCGEARPMPPEGALALGLVQAMGNALHTGDAEAARAQGEAAGKLWLAPPTRLAALLAAALGPAPGELAPAGSLVLRLLPPPPPPPNARRSRRSSRKPPPPSPDPWSVERREAEALARPILGAANSDERTLMAAWAERYGKPVLANLLRPDLPGSPDVVWTTTARALGEPVGQPIVEDSPCRLPFWVRALQP